MYFVNPRFEQLASLPTAGSKDRHWPGSPGRPPYPSCTSPCTSSHGGRLTLMPAYTTGVVHDAFYSMYTPELRETESDAVWPSELFGRPRCRVMTRRRPTPGRPPKVCSAEIISGGKKKPESMGSGSLSWVHIHTHFLHFSCRLVLLPDAGTSICSDGSAEPMENKTKLGLVPESKARARMGPRGFTAVPLCAYRKLPLHRANSTCHYRVLTRTLASINDIFHIP
ncbi:hypothetical protein F4820DRAFT_277692 [Hypoxylon rubiginosum]|uniref:Uncharacterized protein n=1 Tax=Hypoxylon rubiginosum TaxID=110542 RepID=A0ACB9Z4G0_9PEZI|nr:hypothetical protein F4820DRAFT_277692 [Hypoxylon rubiginosum]